MKNLKVRVKLLLGFSVIAVLAIAVGLVGAIGLTNNDATYSKAITFNNKALSALADMRELFLQQRLTVRGMVIDINDHEKVRADINNLKSYETAMADAIAVYESTVIDQNAEKDFYMVKDAYLGAYAATKQKFLEAIENDNHDVAMAAVAEASQAAVPIIDGLKKTVDYCTTMIEADSDKLSDTSNVMIMFQIFAMILAALAAIALGLYISSIISKPIKTMSDFFVRFRSTGDLELSEEDKKNIEHQSKSKDEIGQCVDAAAKLVARIGEVNENLIKVAGGDLTADMKVLSEKDSLGLAFSSMVKNLNSMFSEIRLASDQVSSGAGQIAQGSQMLASGSTEQAASIEEFSAALSELERKIHLNAENSANAQGKSDQAGVMMGESIRSMEQMLKAMNDIDESSKNIIKVIKVIDDIAFQTNILALNAAVEAARAGQHGKGFAVVADEVRNLASKSAEAAKETAALIEGSSAKVMEGNQIVEKTSASLQAVAVDSKEAGQLLQEVASASGEQARAIEEMNQSISQISSVVQSNSASAEQSSAAAQEMSAQSVMLNEIIAKFKLNQSAAEGQHASELRNPDKRSSSKNNVASNKYW